MASNIIRWAAALAATAVVAVSARQTSWNLPQAGLPQAAFPLKDRTTGIMNGLTPAQRYLGTLFPQYHSEGNRILDSLQSREDQFEPGLDAPARTLREFLR